MSTMVPMYGFGGGGGTGAALTVTAPAGCTVTVSKDGKTKTKVAGADGVAVFRGLATGQWTVTITGGEQTAQKTVTVTADYSTAITFFSATIHVTYPAGSTCTATDGVTTLTAPDTSGTWDCVVPNAGTWTLTRMDNGRTEDVTVTVSGQVTEIDLTKYYLYNIGDECEDITGGWKAIKERGGGSFTNSGEELIIQSGGAQNGVTCYTKNKVNLTNVKTVHFSVSTVYTDNSAIGFLVTNASSSWNDYQNNVAELWSDTDTTVKEYTVDVTSVTGKHYICFICYGTSSTKVGCNKIWLS